MHVYGLECLGTSGTAIDTRYSYVLKRVSKPSLAAYGVFSEWLDRNWVPWGRLWLGIEESRESEDRCLRYRVLVPSSLNQFVKANRYAGSV